MYRLKTPWPSTTNVALLQSKGSSHASATKLRQGQTIKYRLEFGVKEGLSISAVAHECLHISKWLLRSDVPGLWVPKWADVPARNQTEETHAFIVETLVHRVLEQAEVLAIPLINPIRMSVAHL